jgi:type IV pilus assembly protein PilA
MNSTKNRLIQKLLLNKKGKKQNGFTLIELMVVIAIVGVLSAVGLPQLLKAQDRAEISAAQQEAVNYAKECSIALLTDGPKPDGAQYETLAVEVLAEDDGDPDTPQAVLTPGQACEEDAPIIATAGGADDPILDINDNAITITVTLDGAIPGKPESSENA